MNELYLGRANIDITPTVQSHLGGWQAERYSDDLHNPLTCRVLYLKKGETTSVIVSLDVLGLSSELSMEIRKAASEKLNIPVHSIIISSTHTHSGPVLPPCLMEGVPLPDDDYIKMLKEKIIGAIYLSKQELIPVKVGFGQGESDLAVSRRLPEADGKIGYPPKADISGTVDDEIGVIRFDSMEDKTLAVLFSYGCHPTVAGPSKWIGPDYPGTARNMVEDYCGEDAMAVFLLGNCADVRANYTQPNGQFSWSVSQDLVEEAGIRVGTEVIKTLVQIECEKDAELKTAFNNENIYTEKGTMADNCEFTSIKIGDVVLLTNPGESFAQIGIDIKNKANHPVMFSSITNGFLGYVPTKEAYNYGGYEVEISYKHFGLDSPISEQGEDVFYRGMLKAYETVTNQKG